MAKVQKQNQPEKAYHNREFISSMDGRTIRLLAEYLEPQQRFKNLNIADTIAFFGSARIKSKKAANAEMNKVKKMDPKKTSNFAQILRKAQQDVEMSCYYEDAVELSRMMTEWSKSLSTDSKRFIVCTGGGPGIMEAANRGAKKAGGVSVGLGISIPMEQGNNEFIEQNLSFEFHYFFMRKFWFAYLSKALVIFPGGFGTMDEMFELITLIQTQKIRKKLAIIIYGEKFWKEIINFEALAQHGMISKNDLKLLSFVNTPDEAFKVLTDHLQKNFGIK